MMKNKPSRILITSVYIGSVIIFVAIFLLSNCSKDDNNPVSPYSNIIVKDIDGNTYKVIKIGKQWWMAENLKVTHYRNGDAIPNVIDDSTWASLTSGSYCNYNNDEINVATYGRLYNWYAVNDKRNIAPIGWHVPSDTEWKELEMYLGMSQSEADAEVWRGTDEAEKLKQTGTEYWNAPNTTATNESGFSALPGGYRDDESGYYNNMGYSSPYWSSTGYYIMGRAWCRVLYHYRSKVLRGPTYYKNGFLVRCVKD